MENEKKTEFTVVLDGIQLPDELHMKINNEIQDVVMRNIAVLDYGKLPWYGQDVPVSGLAGKNLKNNIFINKKYLNGYVAKFINENTLHQAIDAGNLNAVRDTLNTKNLGSKEKFH